MRGGRRASISGILHAIFSAFPKSKVLWRPHQPWATAICEIYGLFGPRTPNTRPCSLRDTHQTISVAEGKRSNVRRWLRLGNIKHWFRKQGNNRGIRVHFTPASYTSQECSACHRIERGNRSSGSRFRCLYCDHQAHADHNASHSIRSRVVTDVLCHELHVLKPGPIHRVAYAGTPSSACSSRCTKEARH